MLRNKGTGYYLTAVNDTANPSSVYVTSLKTTGTDAYELQKWSMVASANYFELDSDTSFNDIAIDINETSHASINRVPENALWSNYTYFDYTIVSGNQYVSYDYDTKMFTGVDEGVAQIQAIHRVTGINKTFEITVNHFAAALINKGLVSVSDISRTDDGFCMFTTPLSSILNTANIYRLAEDTYGNETSEVLNYYDDWYIYAVENSNGYVYSMLKMREQEDDEIDGDDPGVTISFVSFDYSKLIALLNSNTTANSYNYFLELEKVTGPGAYDYDGTISNYFAQVDSDAAYLIAEQFIRVIVMESCTNGFINAPDNYVSIADELELINTLLSNNLLDAGVRESLVNRKNELIRLPNAISENNNNAGYSIYNTTNNTINISNPNSLTMYEKYAILITHTGNVTFNSFAAEVEFHADALYDWKANFPQYYESAPRPDLVVA